MSWIFPSRTLLEILKAAVLYFAIVFGTGFALGPIRVLWAVPRFGERVAELMETPLMLVAIILAARLIVRRFEVGSRPLNSLPVGLIALGLVLSAELSVVMRLRGFSLSEYIKGRDPVSGTVYLVTLAVFALMPWFFARRREGIQLQPCEQTMSSLSR